MRDLNLVKQTFIIISIFVLFTTGCATSDVVKINDEYRILKEGGTMLVGNFRLARLKADALNEANDICKKQAKKLVIVNELSVPVSVGVFARYEIAFKCL